MLKTEWRVVDGVVELIDPSSDSLLDDMRTLGFLPKKLQTRRRMERYLLRVLQMDVDASMKS